MGLIPGKKYYPVTNQRKYVSILLISISFYAIIIIIEVQYDNKEEVLQKVDILYNMSKESSLGGEVMPEDANPHLDKSSVEKAIEDIKFIIEKSKKRGD